MAQDDELNQAVEKSNATLRSSYAARPVVPDSSRPPDIVTDPMQQIGYGGANAGVVDLNARGAPSQGLSEAIDARTKSLLSARDGPVIAPSALAERGPGNVPNSGPIADAASKAVSADFQGVPVPQATQDMVRSSQRIAEAPLSIVPGNQNYKNDYAIMRARDRDDSIAYEANRERALAADNARVAAYEASVKAGNAARFANYVPAENRVFTASTVGPDGPPMRPAPVIAGAAAPMAAPVAAPQRSAVDQELELQKTRAGLETQKTTQAQAGVNLEESRLKLEHQRRLSDLGVKLAAAKDPKERDQLSQTILAMLGKDKPEEYQVVHAPGAETMAADGFTKLKGADSIVIINKRTGAREILQTGGQGAAPAQQTAPPEGATGKHNGKPVVYRNGKWEYA